MSREAARGPRGVREGEPALVGTRKGQFTITVPLLKACPVCLSPGSGLSASKHKHSLLQARRHFRFRRGMECCRLRGHFATDRRVFFLYFFLPSPLRLHDGNSRLGWCPRILIKQHKKRIITQPRQPRLSPKWPSRVHSLLIIVKLPNIRQNISDSLREAFRRTAGTEGWAR